HPWVADLHFAGDIALVSGLVLTTGGIGSFFVSLYALPIVAAGVVRQRRGSLGAAALAALCYGALVLLQYSSWHAGLPEAPVLPPPHDALSRVLINAAGFGAIGVLTGWLALARDRADARLAHASSAIADLQAFNQRIVDSLPGGLLTADEQGSVVSANRSAEVITERPWAQLRGQPVERVLQLAPGAFGDLGPGEVRRVEFEYLKPSAQRIVLGLGMARLGADGGTRGYLFTFQDVTEAKRRQHEAQVQQRLAAIGEMAAGIAHEIRNPLASMAGSIQLLRRELPLDADQALLMDIVLRESQRLNDTIRHFLAYARPQRPRAARVALARLVEETAMLIRKGGDRGHPLTVRVRVDDGSLACEGDEAQLRQVVWNLASNALRAMPDGGTLALGLTRSGAHAVLEVSDTGRGMTREQQERLFQPFQSDFAQGTGLGLAIAHRLVTDHGGTIVVDSAPGRGTTVRVALPALALAEPEPVLEAHVA
nr:ATP-binding protein [Vicinamibacterales bacterium]